MKVMISAYIFLIVGILAITYRLISGHDGDGSYIVSTILAAISWVLFDLNAITESNKIKG